MVHATNYETVSTFVKVKHRKLLVSFFRIRCIAELLVILLLIFASFLFLVLFR